MRKLWITALIVGIALADVSAAQASTEATRWLMPVQPLQVDQQSGRARVEVYNMGQGPTRVAVLPFRNGRLATPSPTVHVLGPGTMVHTEVSGVYDYILVVADKPVIATGAALRLTTATEGQSGQILGSISNGGNGDIGASMRPFNYYLLQSVTAMPIECANAPARHFACSMTFGGISSATPGADFRPRPVDRPQFGQPPGRVQ